MTGRNGNLNSMVLLIILLTLRTPGFAGDKVSDTANQLFTIRMDINFEVEEVNIPGWEEGAFSEPVGAGRVETRLAFPSEGGFPSVQVGEAEITRYGCKGNAGCTCTAPPEIFSTLWKPVILDDIRWDKSNKMMIVKGPLGHPDDKTAIRVKCPGVSTSVEDHPLYKLLGALGTDNTERKSRGFQIPLTGPGPWKKKFPRELYAMGPKVFRAEIIVTISDTAPEAPPENRAAGR